MPHTTEAMIAELESNDTVRLRCLTRQAKTLIPELRARGIDCNEWVDKLKEIRSLCGEESIDLSGPRGAWPILPFRCGTLHHRARRLSWIRSSVSRLSSIDGLTVLRWVVAIPTWYLTFYENCFSEPF